jgi:hypothetical protein
MVMGFAAPETKNDWAGEGQQQLTRPDPMHQTGKYISDAWSFTHYITPDDGDGGDLRTLVFISASTRLIAREDFSTSMIREGFRLYLCSFICCLTRI